MKEFVLDVLGTDYIVKLGTREEIGMSPDLCGECRVFAKEILVSTDCEDRELTKKELGNRTSEILAHEIFHAYLNEAGIEVSDEVEETFAVFFMKVWSKIENTIKRAIYESREIWI